jgi:hypothetical protein
MEFEAANRKRELRLRRRMLSVLDASRHQPAGGWVTGRFVVDVIAGGGGDAIDADAQAISLLRDLVAGGYAEHRDDRRYTYQSEGLDMSSYRVTAKGTSLLAEALEPDPLIDDHRLRKGGR